MPDTDWDAAAYDEEQGFVTERGVELIDLLDPQPGERVLDLGCGTGGLAAEIADRGAAVLGIDASREMVERARAEHPDLDVRVADAREFAAADAFDAVVSNAVLHWIPAEDQDAVLENVADALGEDGRFVAELGGAGNVATGIEALQAELAARGHEVATPWYFPTVGEYAPRLERAGFEVRRAELFDRPTRLDGDGGLRAWLDQFADPFFADVPADLRDPVVDATIERVREDLFDGEEWVLDYRRLRVVAVR